MSTKTCAFCGNLFERDKRCTWSYWSRAKFCSRECFGADKSAKAKANRQPMDVMFRQHFDANSDGCWEWQAAKDKDGYGIFSYARKSYRANKVALILDGRPVPDGMYACHRCNNPACVRPDHLYPGTPTQNMEDARQSGTLRMGEDVHFSKLTERQVKAIREASGTHEEIAEEFGVSRPCVSLVRARRTWRHVA